VAGATRIPGEGENRVDYRKALLAKPGTKTKLKNVDPSFHGKHESHKAALAEIQTHLERLQELQYTLYAEHKHSLLVVLQGIDAAGKDGVCRHVFQAMNPQGASVAAFKQPTPDESSHDFLWRVHRRAPGSGEVVVFNRSHYEDVLVARVHDLVPKSVWEPRYDRINEFEKLLSDANTTIVKFFLYISKDEQLDRFKTRLDDKSRHWKISDNDYTERKYWDDYIAAYEDMLDRCSTPHAPWYVIPANHKWFRNLAVSQILCDTMAEIGMTMPAATVDLDLIREKYHQAIERSQHKP
jgi:PPK2 family polyphosphate:nucleotide phosphotransferase